MKQLNIGVVGLGFIGMQHVEAIRRVPNTNIVALCGADDEATKNAAKRLGIKLVSLDEMLDKSTGIDVIHNCTPNSLHYEINEKVLKADIHLYCEKPFTVHSHESEKIVAIASEKNLKIGVNFNYRHNAMVEEMKERVANKAIGKPHFIMAEYLQDWLLFETDFNWRVDRAFGGETRAVADIGSHCFDTIQYILGEKIVKVNATMRTLHKTRKTFEGKDFPVDTDDSAIINVIFESGLEALVRVSQISSGKKNDFSILIEATEQALQWHQEKPDRLWIGNRDCGNMEIFADAKYLTGRAQEKINLPNGHPVGWADALANAVHSFYNDVRNIDGAIVDYTTGEEAHYVMKIIDACVISNKNKQWVSV